MESTVPALTESQKIESAVRRKAYLARFRAENKDLLKKWQKTHYAKNKGKRSASARKWAAENPERVRELQRLWYKSEKGRRAKREYIAMRRKTNPIVRLKGSITSRIRRALLKDSGRKADKTEILLGCTVSHLRDYIEGLFEPGMTWENRHLWHVDHIRPCASFDLLNSEQQRCCFHYSNLQPLWAKANWEKADKCL